MEHEILKLNLEWYAIRDLFFGQNGSNQDMRRALLLASKCMHPDAQWLISVFGNLIPRTKLKAIAAFSSLKEDAKAICFAALLSSPIHYEDLCKSANMGYAFAQAYVAHYILTRKEGLSMSQKSASQGERDGFYQLAYYLRIQDNVDVELVRKNMRLAATLKHRVAMFVLATYLSFYDPYRWQLLGNAAQLGHHVKMFFDFVTVVKLYKKGALNRAPILFVIGKMLNGHVDTVKKRIFDSTYNYKYCLKSALYAIDFYKNQCNAARAAVNTWLMIAHRIGSALINKDIRRKIGMLIWSEYELACYTKEEIKTRAAKRARK